MREYETTIVLDPGLDETRVNQEIETVGNVITQGGGEVLEVWRWGRRRLAYEIGKRREGVYTVIRFRSEPQVLADLEKRFKLNESLMRHQIMKSSGPIAIVSDERGPGDGHDRREGRHDDRGRGFGHGEGRGRGRSESYESDDDDDIVRPRGGGGDDQDDDE